MRAAARRTDPVRHRRSRRRIGRDEGYVLALTALMMLPILAFTGFAVDLGSWYARASQIQRAADAASLAGVQELPNLANATSAANAVAQRNGFTNGVNGVTITIAQVPDPTAKLKVTIADANANQYFTKVFRPSVSIERTGTAQYIKPVSMGSPKNFLGTGNRYIQDPPGYDTNTSCTGGQCFRENFWLAVSGGCASKENGDRIQAQTDANYGYSRPSFRCTGASTITNPEYDSNGYFYAVEFKQNVTGSVNVQIYDAPLCNGSIPGDSVGSGETAFNTTYTMRDNSSFDPLQTGTLTSVTLGSGNCTANGSWQNTWKTLYTINNPTKGVYFVQVQSQTGSGSTKHGSNAFALRAGAASWVPCSSDTNETSSGAIAYSASCPQVYGYANLGVYANLAGTQAQFYLAQIGPDYNNKKMELSLWDPGEGSVALQILDPNDQPVDFDWEVRCYDGNPSPCNDGTVAPTDTGQGSWTGTSATITLRAGPLVGTTIPKAIDIWGNNYTGATNPSANNPQPGPNRTSSSKYSDRLLKFTIQLPADITAAFGGKQWYKIKYYIGSSSTDRTTWGVTVKGAPIRLIPNP